jgi:hypothetical protein
MENTISHFQVDGLEIKLTEDKLFINTAASNEAFALRSIDGIGVIDLVENFNKSMDLYKELNNKTKMGKIFALIGIAILFFAIILYFNDSPFIGVFLGFPALVFIFSGLANMYKNLQIPTLKSAVRIMMSGGNRDFIFDKADANSNSIAEFVAKVENTLTAFHNKNA